MYIQSAGLPSFRKLKTLANQNKILFAYSLSEFYIIFGVRFKYVYFKHAYNHHITTCLRQERTRVYIKLCHKLWSRCVKMLNKHSIFGLIRQLGIFYTSSSVRGEI